MKLQIQADQKDLFHKACLELGFTCQFHDVDKEDLKPLMVNVYVRDNSLGELSPKLAFYLGMQFCNNIHAEINLELRFDTMKIN